MKKIHVFISEDPEVSEEILTKYFEKRKVAYAAEFNSNLRHAIVRVLNKLADE